MSSHLHLRTDNHCLNCGAAVIGPYCHMCSQANVEPKESVWHLIGHFIEDLTHFDGKFFSSLKYLILKPGFLSEQYVKGKRASYLNPIRMYLFISAIVLLIISGTFFTPTHNTAHMEHIRDSVLYNSNVGPEEIHTESYIEKENTFYALSFYKPYIYGGARSYDSLHKNDKKPQAWLDKFVGRTFASAAYTYARNPNEFMNNFTERVVHSFSKIFFISLPLFAFILMLVYIRRRHTFYYASHVIFALHFYCIAFLLMLLFAFLVAADNISVWPSVVVLISIFVYLYIAMLRFYKQGWFKTLIKFFITSACIVSLLVGLTIVFFINSFISTATG
ncbi:MAG: DUF3667 domain-containing protein [Flavipsychrobacter sp.]